VCHHISTGAYYSIKDDHETEAILLCFKFNVNVKMVEIECNEPLPWGELGTLLELTLKVALG
jgi:hypothetical protein